VPAGAQSLGEPPPSRGAHWMPTFGSEPIAGRVEAVASFDDGSGAAVYAAGEFLSAGGHWAADIARWDGEHWSDIGDGATPSVFDGEFRALAVFDDGSGPALYAGGSKSSIAGVPVSHIGRWDGTQWSALGGGLDDRVFCLAVFDDGTGPALYAGGEFLNAGGVPAARIARWDGREWSALGSGTTSPVETLLTFDDGSGPALYAGGAFISVDGVTVNGIARWDGTEWSSLDIGVTPHGTVHALGIHDDGNGPDLYAGGSFSSAGGVPAGRLARWDGERWSGVGGGVIGGPGPSVRELISFDDGNGPDLYVAGFFSLAGGVGGLPTGGIARWDGAEWSALGPGVTGFPTSLVVHDFGSGPRLVVAGGGGLAGELLLGALAIWDGEAWSPTASGLVGGPIYDVAIFDDGDGPGLYAAGAFTYSGAGPVNRIGRWDGSRWQQLAEGIGFNNVRALAVHDEGTGPALYAGGSFQLAGQVAASNIARWDGSSWEAAGSLPVVFDLVTYDDGSGPVLYAASGGVQRWNGTSWSAIAGGSVRAMAVYDDESGAALYATHFDNTTGESNILRWDGTSLSEIGAGLNNSVLALAVHDGGSGPVLVAGGSFTTIGSVSAQRVATWDGASWSALGDGIPSGNVLALRSYDDGTGPALYAGGSFGSFSAGQIGVPGNRIARWNGRLWEPLGEGLGLGSVEALMVSDLPGVSGLIVAGSFTISEPGDSLIARWAPDVPPSPWMDLGGGTSGVNGQPLLTMSGPLTPSSIVTLQLVDASPSSLAVILLSHTSMPVPFLGGVLHSSPIDRAVFVPTNASGGLGISQPFPGAEAGLQLWFQVIVSDTSVVPFGAALSNAVVGTIP